eukprot:12899654-Prorocentrum_lima.AAC.1
MPVSYRQSLDKLLVASPCRQSRVRARRAFQQGRHAKRSDADLWRYQPLRQNMCTPRHHGP